MQVCCKVKNPSEKFCFHQLFVYIFQGWVREVIYDRNEDGSLCPKAREVVYHAPLQGASKPRTFKSQSELRPYCKFYNFHLLKKVQNFMLKISNFFPVANSPSLTLHNFSFRNDPLNAPKGQEIIHAFDEAVEIFPAQIDTMEKMMVAKAPAKSQDRKLAAASASTASESTSLSPSLPSGLLKVKMFGKMKEKNTFDTPPQGSGTGHSMGGGASPSTVEAEVTMEIDDDEDFDLETPNNGTQSLGNSGVTITPISSLNKSKRKNESPIANIHLPANFELTKKSKFSNPSKENKPFTLGSTTITSAMGPSTTKAKALPSVTLTPTGNQGAGAKKRASFGGKGATPLRPIEAQSVVNIAGMKYLVVPHPDPGKSCKKFNFCKNW